MSDVAPETIQFTTANGYTATDDHLWAPNGDAVVEIVNGKLLFYPDLQDALNSLPAKWQGPDGSLTDVLIVKAEALERMARDLRLLAIKARGQTPSQAMERLREAGAVHGNWDHLKDD